MELSLSPSGNAISESLSELMSFVFVAEQFITLLLPM